MESVDEAAGEGKRACLKRHLKLSSMQERAARPFHGVHSTDSKEWARRHVLGPVDVSSFLGSSL